MPENGLSVIVWNCNGLTEQKLSDPDFKSHLCENDVIILLESWTDNSSEIEIEGFFVYNFYRKFRHKRARRNSGGIVIYIRENIKNGISVVKNHFDTLIWLKFDKHFFRFQEDIYLCGLYLWSEDAPIASSVDVDLFDLLSQDIASYENLGSILLAGDWNCRVGTKLDFIDCDRFTCETDFTDYIPDRPLARASKDKIVNTRGIRLLDFCKTNTLRLANGRLGIDFDRGEFTYFNKKACSTIDYLLLREHDFPRVTSFQIGSFNMYSDHASLRFNLFGGKSLPNIPIELNISDEYYTYSWDQDKRDVFRRRLIGKLPDFNKILNNVNLSDTHSIESMVSSFSSKICEVADPLFMKRKSLNKTRSRHAESQWFDTECYEAKSLYKQYLREFNRCKSYENRLQLCEFKTKYKTLIRKKKRGFMLKKAQQLTELKKHRPRDFWKHFGKSKFVSSSPIHIEDFKQHFSDVYSNIGNSLIEEVESYISSADFNIENPTFTELNTKITYQEVQSAIRKLNRNKASCPTDNLINEYFLEADDILTGHLTDLFNMVFDSGCFPQKWSEGYIIPIYKKGDKSVPNNYRGITIMSNLGKLFTSILTSRVEKWFESNDLLSDAQFGFRRGRSTVDACFILQNLIEHFMQDKKRFPCAFVDLKKAFDSVYRNALWFKLLKMGLDGKILRIFKAMYVTVKSCVKHLNSLSDFFDIAVGLKQGLNNSPVLFALFLEDLELFLQNQMDSGVSIIDICIIVLLFADDMVVVGNSVEDLQNSLNQLHEYCQYWGLEVNIDKTKIVVFRKRGHILPTEKWFYNGQDLEVVDNINYLGTVFNYTGSFVLNNQYIIGKSLKAMNILLYNIKKVELCPEISLQLFDAFVGSILNFGCPIWGFSKSKELERVQLKFSKQILGVRSNSSNAAIYGELGRFPLYIKRYVLILKYWLKLLHTDNVILKRIYQNSLERCKSGSKNNWANKVKTLLDTFGFSDYWLYQNNIDETRFISIFETRLLDCFKQTWSSDIENNRVLKSLYQYIKPNWGLENYIRILNTKQNRSALTKIRISSHNLRIESGRYGRQRIERSDRVCTVCNSGEIEDEYHFILICPAYSDFRKNYIRKYFRVRPNMFKLLQLLNPSNVRILLNLSRFIICATKKRLSLLNANV